MMESYTVRKTLRCSAKSGSTEAEKKMNERQEREAIGTKTGERTKGESQ